jgi:hypothetical protein
LDAGPVLLRRSVFLAGGRTRGCKAFGGVVGRSNPAESLRTEIAAANFELGSAAQFGKLQVILGEEIPLLARYGRVGRVPARRLSGVFLPRLLLRGAAVDDPISDISCALR